MGLLPPALPLPWGVAARLPSALLLLQGVAAVRLSPTPGVRRGEHTEGEEGGVDEAAEEAAGEERGVRWLSAAVAAEGEEGDVGWQSAVEAEGEERDVG